MNAVRSQKCPCLNCCGSCHRLNHSFEEASAFYAHLPNLLLLVSQRLVC